MKVGVIINPNSGRNQVFRPWVRHVKRMVEPYGIVRLTNNLEEVRETIHDFIQQEVLYYVADGGDGTFNWMLNIANEVFLEKTGKGVDEQPVMLLPSRGGTINFLANAAGIFGNRIRIIKSLVNSCKNQTPYPKHPLPSFIATGTKEIVDQTKDFYRIGFASAIGGIAQRFLEHYYGEKYQGGVTILKIIGKAVSSYLLENEAPRFVKDSLPENFRRYSRRIFQPCKAEVYLDGFRLPFNHYGAINVGAVPANLANIVRIFNKAEDGNLHIHAGAITPMDIIKSIPGLVSGGSYHSEELVDSKAKSISIIAAQNELLHPNIDGEIFYNFKELHINPGPIINFPDLNGQT